MPGPENYYRFNGALVGLRRNFTRFADVGGGILGCRALHLDLNILLELLPSDQRGRNDDMGLQSHVDLLLELLPSPSNQAKNPEFTVLLENMS
ncbi:hypothetical protein Tco_0016999 [Tanacetum coccineum]